LESSFLPFYTPSVAKKNGSNRCFYSGDPVDFNEMIVK